uniref:Putative odorant binding protein 42 n=1 Tax=Nasonia vitripennis TaxID=7425 RepID=G8B1P7_NASVI|nr:putative odorant binding protein 42 [Nasonia vitripennis]
MHYAIFYICITFAIILVLAFVWQPITASFRVKYSETCLMENGFTDSPSVVACVYQKQYADKNLNNALKVLIDRDDKVSEDEAKKMKETLATCNTNAAGDNAKLLSCVNLVAPPFDTLIAVIRDLPESQDPCFLKCDMKIGMPMNIQIITISSVITENGIRLSDSHFSGEMYKAEQNRNKMKDLVKHVPEEKLSCIFGCKVDEFDKTKPGGKVHDENHKKEMLETLKRCTDTVAGQPNENTLLGKCLDLFNPPFVDIY